MNEQKYKARIARLMPNGVPRYIRVFDNGGTTADRYTVIFTHAQSFYTKGWFPVLGMSASPFHPQGVGMHNEYNSPIDRPSYKHLGKKIRFQQLPYDCQALVLQDYKDYWDINRAEETTLPFPEKEEQEKIYVVYDAETKEIVAEHDFFGQVDALVKNHSGRIFKWVNRTFRPHKEILAGRKTRQE